MDAFVYLFLTYAFIWLGIFGYMWYVNKKTDQVSQDVMLLKEMIEAKK